MDALAKRDGANSVRAHGVVRGWRLANFSRMGCNAAFRVGRRFSPVIAEAGKKGAAESPSARRNLR